MQISMGKKDAGKKYSEEEIAKRRDEALLRALSTPPKPHSAMKLGKRNAKASTKAIRPKNGGRTE
jgi:hypothetical protein